MNRCEDFPCCGHYDKDGTFCPPQFDDEPTNDEPDFPDYPEDFYDPYGDGIYDPEEAYLNFH